MKLKDGEKAKFKVLYPTVGIMALADWLPKWTAHQDGCPCRLHINGCDEFCTFHTTADGEELHLHQMNDDHLVRTLATLRALAKEASTGWYPQGEHAQDAFEREVEELDDHIGEVREELIFRGLLK